jgi:hypothetical protein
MRKRLFLAVVSLHGKIFAYLHSTFLFFIVVSRVTSTLRNVTAAAGIIVA